MIKDLKWEAIHPYKLRRVEHPQCSVTNAMKRLGDIGREDIDPQ